MGPEPSRADAAPHADNTAVADTADPSGSIRSRIATAMVSLKKDYYGRGPDRAKTYINDDYIFVALEGGLTRNEETMLEAGEHELVRNYRLRFQAAMADTATKAVEEIVGRAVLTYHSQILFEPARAFEIFVLEPEEDVSRRG